jgi:hypothetical protein
MAIDWAGSLPFFLDRKFYDILGKSDSVIAHEPMRHNSSGSNIWYHEFYPGHMKWDADYTIGKLTPDVVLIIWVRRPGVDFAPSLNAEYVAYSYTRGKIYLRKDSHKIRWDQVPSIWRKL